MSVADKILVLSAPVAYHINAAFNKLFNIKRYRPALCFNPHIRKIGENIRNYNEMYLIGLFL